MNAKVFASFLIISLIALPNCKNAEQKRIIEAVENGAKIIDISPANEFEKNHRDDAINIPVSELNKRLPEVGSKNKPVIIHSQSGKGSVKDAIAILERAGYTQVINGGGFQKLHMAIDH